MTSLITAQLDYIYFFYGISFVFLGVITFALYLLKDSKLPWKYLSAFGFIHGVNEWLDMGAYVYGDSTVFYYIRLLFLLVSFLTLFEFGRLSFKVVFNKQIPIWITSILLLLSLSGIYFSKEALNDTIRFFLCIPGGLLTSIVFIKIYPIVKGQNMLALRLSALFIFLYAIAAGVIVPKSEILPAWFFNASSFSELTGLPVQLIRGIITYFLTILIWIYFTSRTGRSVYKYGYTLIFLFTVILATGAIFSYITGVNRKDEIYKNIGIVNRVGAASINPARVKTLAWNDTDYQNENYIFLLNQIKKMTSVNESVRWFYILGMRDNKIYITVDPSPKDSPFFSPIGEEYTEAPEGAYKAFEGEAVVSDEYTDRWGTYVSGFSPIFDYDGDHVIAVLGNDTEVSQIQQESIRAKVPVVFIIFLIEMFVLSSFLVYEKILQNNEELAESADNLQKFKLAVDNVEEHVVITDADGKVLYANEAVEKITGFPLNEVIGTKAGTLWGKLMSKEVYEKLWYTLKVEKKSFRDEFLNHRKNGEKYTAEAAISIIKNEKGEVKYMVGIERDITKAKEVDRMKTEFISLASHQLRTPLSAMKWYLEMLLAGDVGNLNEEQESFIKKVDMSNERMIDLVNSLLNVSRIESGRIMIEPQPTDIKQLIKEVVIDLGSKIKEKDHNFVVSIADNLPLVSIDPKLIRQVIQNLLTNAIKYTAEKGEINVFVSKDSTDIIIQISDNGFGIPEKEKDKVFNKFYRGENIIQKETDGNGLGLYLVKAIIESSKGKVWYESKENKGTTFWISLPLCGSPRKEGVVSINS
jgi:PAS domain S-box-containing protein